MIVARNLTTLLMEKDLSDLSRLSLRGMTRAQITNLIWDLVVTKRCTRKEVAQALEKSPFWINQYMQIHNLHPDLLKKMDPPTPFKERLTLKQARAIAKAPLDKQIEIYKNISGFSKDRALLAARILVERESLVRGRTPLKTFALSMATLLTMKEEVDELYVFADDPIDARLRWVLAHNISMLMKRMKMLCENIMPPEAIREYLRSQGFDIATACNLDAQGILALGNQAKSDLTQAIKIAEKLFGNG